MHIERISHDPSVFLEMEPKLEDFFIHCIFPKVLCGDEESNDSSVIDHGGNDTCVRDGGSNAVDDSCEDLYCFCQGGDFGQMIGCDNIDCPFQWFHFQCVNIVEVPEGDRYCPHCINKFCHIDHMSLL